MQGKQGHGTTNNGAFQRGESAFRNWIRKDDPVFQPENGRYHLYVAMACPWATRCLAVRSLKGLHDCISLSVVHPTWEKTKPNVDDHAGWVFKPAGHEMTNTAGNGLIKYEQGFEDHLYGFGTVRQLYEKASKDGSEPPRPYSVPILWDKKTETIVNNESSEIIQILNAEFNDFAKNASLDLNPEDTREKQAEVNDWIYHGINNGVYRNGFAKTQEAYDEANKKLFDHLDKLDALLSTQKWVASDSKMTLADVRAFQTLVRFDEVYIVYFKCDKKRIEDYPNIMRFCKDFYNTPGVAETIDMHQIKTHYYTSHAVLNHYAIIPTGTGFIQKITN